MREEISRRQYEKMMKTMRQREGDQERRQEGAAQLIVKKALQRLRLATSDNWMSVADELQQILCDQMIALGSMFEGMDKEVQAAVAEASAKFDPYYNQGA
mmetsp:Transcript_32695/g.59407  ORF Transcript_32695/g.59407 Transcript_32695/m.59407 type:complete len:100 (+) Transcript_32695:2-301(+)